MDFAIIDGMVGGVFAKWRSVIGILEAQGNEFWRGKVAWCVDSSDEFWNT